MRAKDFITEGKMPSIKDQIIDAVRKNGGKPNDYFVRFTFRDKLGFHNKQVFSKYPDVGDPNFDVDYIGREGSKRSLYFYPLRTYLNHTDDLWASEGPYVWLVKLKPDAWLQKVGRFDKTVEQPPSGKKRVGIIRMSNTPAAIFFTIGYDLVGKYYNYPRMHKRHGQVKGPQKVEPTPTTQPTMWQKFKSAFV